MRRLPRLAVSVVLVVAACARTPMRPAPAALDATLEPYLGRYGLPALAAAVVRNGEIVAAAAVGTRRVGTQIPVTIDDRFHLGSDTKAMTSLVAATFVEEGKLRWDTTVAEVYPELAAGMDARLRGVTVEQLLSHSSGIPGDTDADDKLINDATLQPGNLDAMRYWAVQRLVKRPLQSAPGTHFAYANMGYLLMGAMLERIGGKTWEELVAERVFTPLALHTAGFGPQSSLGRLDAPLGHRTGDGRLEAMLAGPNGDNPAVIGPAGTAHMSVLDFAAWAAWNAGEGKRGPALVTAATMRKLHTPVIAMAPRPDAAPGTPALGRYGLGWGEIPLPFSPEPFVFHGGSNQMNLAYILIQPQRDFGMVLMTNVGNPQADEALKALAAEIYEHYGNGDERR